jgi:hypothetical protein
MGSWLCTTEHWLQLASAVFAALAAWKWFTASLGKLPAQATFENLDGVYAIIGRQSRQNAYAAAFAGVAALLQLPQSFMPTCWSGAPWFLSN